MTDLLAVFQTNAPSVTLDANQVTKEELLKSVSLHQIVDAMKELPLDGSDATGKKAQFLGELYKKKYDAITESSPLNENDIPSGRRGVDDKAVLNVLSHVNRSGTALQKTFVNKTVDWVVAGISNNTGWWVDTHMPQLDAYTNQAEPLPKDGNIIKRFFKNIIS